MPIIVRTAKKGKKTYSIDMMFAYINIYKPAVVEVPISAFDTDLDSIGWGNVSANKVLKDPKKYKDDHYRIVNAKLVYPIIIDKSYFIYDGVHRLAKSIMLGKKTIKAYIIDDTLSDKFVISSTKYMGINDYIEHFNKIELL